MSSQITDRPPVEPRSRWRLLVAVAAVIVVVAAVGVTVALLRTGRQSTPAASPSGSASASGSASVTPSAGTPSATPSAAPAPAPVFGFQPLWPFAGTADAAAWQRSYRAGGHQPWHLDPGQTALSFTRSYLGYTELDRVTSRRVVGTQAWVGVGYANPNGRLVTAAVLHLARIGSGADAPWEVVGSRDATLSLTTPDYGATVSSPVTVGGRITGVDESLRVQVRALGAPLLGQLGGIPAGGQDTPWSARVAFTAPAGTVLTIAVSTGGHLLGVERFAITGVRAGAATG